MVSPISLSLNEVNFCVFMNVVSGMAFDVFLRESCWRTYLLTFDPACKRVSGVESSGKEWSLLLLPSRDNYLKLGVVTFVPGFFLPDEFSDFASLFEPSCKVPLFTARSMFLLSSSRRERSSRAVVQYAPPT